METITAKFTITTPMFISGADQNRAELHAASIKGLIRFWWRALHYAECKTLETLKEKEENLFGSTRKQSSVRFIIEPAYHPLQCSAKNKVPQWLNDKPGCIYLGYGVADHTGGLERPCINPDQEFTLRLVARKEIDSSIVNAVKLFGLIGGAGAKSRKGYGSVSLVEFLKNGKEMDCPVSWDEYTKQLKELLAPTGAWTMPSNQSFTAFAGNSRVDLLSTGSDSIDILNSYGETMQLYRSWGRHNKLPSGQRAEQNFKNDHDWFKNDNNFRANNPEFHPERALFGLPHNYYSQGTGSEMVKPVGCERRGTPLFFHVHKLTDNEFLGVSILLPSKFLPDKKGGNISAAGSKTVQEKNYDVLTRFLEGKRGAKDSKTDKDYFPNRQSIWPVQQEEQA